MCVRSSANAVYAFSPLSKTRATLFIVTGNKLCILERSMSPLKPLLRKSICTVSCSKHDWYQHQKHCRHIDHYSSAQFEPSSSNPVFSKAGFALRMIELIMFDKSV